MCDKCVEREQIKKQLLIENERHRVANNIKQLELENKRLELEKERFSNNVTSTDKEDQKICDAIIEIVCKDDKCHLFHNHNHYCYARPQPTNTNDIVHLKLYTKIEKIEVNKEKWTITLKPCKQMCDYKNKGEGILYYQCQHHLNNCDSNTINKIFWQITQSKKSITISYINCKQLEMRI